MKYVADHAAEDAAGDRHDPRPARRGGAPHPALLAAGRPTPDVEKLLNSAVANAEQKPGVIAENLVVARAWVDEGPTLRRYRPRAYGRATRVRKRTSHVTLVVETMGDED